MKYRYKFPYKDLPIWKTNFDRYLSGANSGKFRVSIPAHKLKSRVLKFYDSELFYDFFEQISVELAQIDEIVVEFQMNQLTLFTSLLPLTNWDSYKDDQIQLEYDDIKYIRQINQLVSRRMLNLENPKHFAHPFLFGEQLSYQRFPAVLRALDYAWEISNVYFYPSVRSAFVVVMHSSTSRAFVLSQKGIEDIGQLYLHFDFDKGFYTLDSDYKRQYLAEETLFMQDFAEWRSSNRTVPILKVHV